VHGHPQDLPVQGTPQRRREATVEQPQVPHWRGTVPASVLPRDAPGELFFAFESSII